MKRPILFKDDGFYNLDDVKKELKRIFNICHGCRRCFNLCALFPKLFDILDQPDIDGDVDKLTDEHFRQIMPLCTLCDMCFMVKCPYVPPHPWNVDFPRVILRYKAIQAKKITVRAETGDQTIGVYGSVWSSGHTYGASRQHHAGQHGGAACNGPCNGH